MPRRRLLFLAPAVLLAASGALEAIGRATRDFKQLLNDKEAI